MDENKINSTPDEVAENTADAIEDAADAAVEEVAAETSEAVVEGAADESVEADAEETSQEDAEEPAEAQEEAEAEEVTAEEPPVKKKKMRTGAKVVIGILVSILAITILGMAAIFIASLPPKMDLDDVAVSVDGVDSSAAEFYQTYIYYYSYNSYYGYTDEQLKELAIDQLVFTNTLYAEAKENGFELSEEAKAELADQLASVKTTAEAESMSADEYLDSAFCPGFTLEMFEALSEKSMIAQEYYSTKIEKIENGYKGDEGFKKIEAAYNKNKGDYDLTDVLYWYFDASAEDSLTKANKIAADVKGGKSFEAAVKAVADAEVKNLSGRTKAELKSGSFPTDAIDWIFETDAEGKYVNGTGSVEVVSDDSLVYVIYIENAPARNEVYPVSAYYIQIDVGTDTSVKSEDMLKIEAKNTAEAILKDYEATGKKTAEGFAEFAAKQNSGDNDLVSADMFEKLKGDGSEAVEVEAWLFNADRKADDYALIDAGDCYYIVYYVEKAENPVWYDTIFNSLVSAEVTSLQEDMLAEAKEVKTVNDDVIADVVEYVEYVANSYSSSY